MTSYYRVGPVIVVCVRHIGLAYTVLHRSERLVAAGSSADARDDTVDASGKRSLQKQTRLTDRPDGSTDRGNVGETGVVLPCHGQ